MGLMQLMPGTAEYLGVLDPFSISDNVFGGARYLSEMMTRFDDDIELALAAYNAGPGSVERHGRSIPPFQETQKYVPAVLNHKEQYIMAQYNRNKTSE
jgi:soluble lytic murein transglycosylase-like protein